MKNFMCSFPWASEIRRIGWERALLKLFGQVGGVTIEDIARLTGRSEKTARKHVDRLIGQGVLYWYSHPVEEYHGGLASLVKK